MAPRCAVVVAALVCQLFAPAAREASAQAPLAQLGPEGARVWALAIHPTTSSTVYVGTVGGGVYRSTDAGVSWTAVSEGLLDNLGRLPIAVGALAIHPVMPSILFAGTQGGAGIYRSSDGGQTWTAATMGVPATAWFALAIDPQSPSIVYAGSWGSGVYRSADGGSSWTAAGLAGQFVQSLVIDPLTPATIYAGTSSGVYRSADSGATWAMMNAGLPAGAAAVRSLAVDPATPTILYAALGGGVFRSVDGAVSWTQTSPVGSSFQLAIDPQTPTTVLVGARNGLHRSVNSGASWTAVNTGLRAFGALDQPEVRAIVFDPTTPSTVYIGLTSGGAGVFRSTNGGASWGASNTALRASRVSTVILDPLSPSTLHVGTQGDGVHRSGDGGATWTALRTGIASEIGALTVDSAAQPTFYAGSEDGDVYRRPSGTDIWTRVSTGLPARAVTALATDPVSPSIVYAGTLDRGVYRSVNQGTTWVQRGLSTQQVVTLAVDPLTPANLYAGTVNGFFRSTDAGANWISSSAGLTGGVRSLVIDPVVPSTLYAGTGFGVFRSLDSGSSWTPSSTGLTSTFVQTLAIDPVDARILYAATVGGVFCSTNSGATWYLLSDFHGIELEALASPRASPTRLYLGSFGSSALGLDIGQDDGDGLPTSWEIDFGLSPHSGTGGDGAAGDPDGDGLTNGEELLRGTHPRGTFTRYLAEGATGAFFSTRLALANPGDVARSVLLRFLRSNGQVLSHVETLRPLARLTIDVATVDAALVAEEFSVVLEADGPVALDRTMTWDHTGYGSHTETSVASPATTWYLAEGATHSGFNLFYLLQNPNAAEAHVRVRYLRPSGAPLDKTYTLLPTSRTNIWVDLEEFPAIGQALLDTDVSAVFEVLNGQPIIVERAMYLDVPGQSFAAGHESAGITAPALEWFLAEGATGSYFDLFVLIANPGATDAQLEATYLLPDGTTIVKPYVIAANSRFNIWVDLEDAQLADTAVSTTIRSINAVPVVVERAMWWPGGGWHEAHNSPGATTTGARWALAEGEVDASRNLETYILVANTSETSATVKVTLLFEDGPIAEQTYTAIPAKSRFNVPVGAFFPQAAGRRFGSIVESLGTTPAEIVVERAMYWDAAGQRWAAGTNALAMKLQ